MASTRQRRYLFQPKLSKLGQSSPSNGPASADLTISSGNNSPAAADDTAMTNEEQAVVIDVSANDSDSDGSLDLTSVIVTQDPLNGSTW